QVLNVRQPLPTPPAFQKCILGRVHGIVPIAQEEHQRADQFVAQLVERAHQRVVGGGKSSPVRDRPGGRARAESLHGCYLYDGYGPPTDGGGAKKKRERGRRPASAMLTAGRGGSNRLVTYAISQ